MGVAPRDPKVVRQQLDRVDALRPLGRLHDHIKMEIGGPERRVKSLDIRSRPNARTAPLRLVVNLRSYFK